MDMEILRNLLLIERQQELVGRYREKLFELVLGRQCLEQRPRLLPTAPSLVQDNQVLDLAVDELTYPLARDLGPVVETCVVMDPLPNLGSADLGGGSVFHQVVDGHTAGAAQPRLDVANAYPNVVREPRFGAGPLGHG